MYAGVCLRAVEMEISATLPTMWLRKKNYFHLTNLALDSEHTKEQIGQTKADSKSVSVCI